MKQRHVELSQLHDVVLGHALGVFSNLQIIAHLGQFAFLALERARDVERLVSLETKRLYLLHQRRVQRTKVINVGFRAAQRIDLVLRGREIGLGLDQGIRFGGDLRAQRLGIARRGFAQRSQLAHQHRVRLGELLHLHICSQAIRSSLCRRN